MKWADIAWESDDKKSLLALPHSPGRKTGRSVFFPPLPEFLWGSEL
jgi:hypothetical protein